MLNIEEAYHIMGGSNIGKMWEKWIACAPTDKRITLSTNRLKDTVKSISFTVILQGTIELVVGDQELTFHPGELFIHLPGFPIYINKVSDDYRGICLAIDEQAAYQSAALRKIIRGSSFFMTSLAEPLIPLKPGEARRIEQLMMMIHDYIQHPSSHTEDVLNMLLSVFLLNVHDSLQWMPQKPRVTKRDEEVFMVFYSLLRHNFMHQHHIGFYADRLNMTTTHLLRIVKSVTGRTVVSFIDQMLMMESIWLLVSTNFTINQIADRLNFASASSFNKFFTRMKGISPKQLREKRKLE